MGGVKHMKAEVAQRMEIPDENDPRVEAEVERLLSLHQRRLVLIESHPNSGGFWVGKMGSEREVLQYLKKLENDGTLDYLFNIIELKEGANDEVTDWAEFDGIEPIKVMDVTIGSAPQPTPPLPGLEKRLARIRAESCGQHRSAWTLLQAMTDEEVAFTFSECLEGLLQMGRELPEASES